MFVYSGEFYSTDNQGCGFFEKDMICIRCGNVIDRLIKETGDSDFRFSIPEKKNYKYCPYCGENIYK